MNVDLRLTETTGVLPERLEMKLKELGPDDTLIHDESVQIGTVVKPLQAQIYEWSRDTFGAPIEQVVLKMKHEHDELQEEVVGYRAAIDLGDDAAQEIIGKEIAKEAADVTFMLMQLAEIIGFDLIEETRAKFNINKARNWQKQADGTFQHIKE